MTQIGATLQRALQQHQAGNLSTAEQLYRQVLAASPRNADALHLLGVLEHQCGRCEAAVETIRRAIAVDPRQPIFHNNLAAAYRALDQLEEAAGSYEEALKLKPDYADALSNLATVELARGRATQAAELCRRALQLSHEFVEAHNNLGNALKDLGQLAEAERSYRQAIALRPDFALAHNNLGTLFDEQRRPADAQACFEQALKLDPQHAPAWNNLGNVLLVAGRHADARRCFQNSLTIEPRCGLRIKAALALPYVYRDAAEMDHERRRVEQSVYELLNQPLRVADPVHEIGATAMNLAYHGRNDRDLLQSIARLLLHAASGLNFVAPHCREQHGPKDQRSPLRLGIISRHLYDHSNARLNAGFLRELSQPDLHVTLLRFPGRDDDAMSRFVAEKADAVVTLPSQLEPARQAIADLKLDVLFYTDIGMEPLTWCLAFARLAPVQCTTWGVPGTTGIPNIDYFLSSSDLEPEGAADHYSERLVLLDHLPTYYYRPAASVTKRTRSDFGLADDRHLYLCPQSLFKLHPDFDAILARILKADSLGQIVLIEGGHPHWTHLLRERLAQSMGETVRRVLFLPQLPSPDFLELLALADVMLDPIHFGGGNTTLEALAFGTPIVTLPGNFLRSRVTYACYRQMGVLDAVAANTEDYARLAVELGTDADRRSELRSRLLAGNSVLYENVGILDELRRFFREAGARGMSTR